MFDGEFVVLDDAGRPQFDGLLFERGRPTYADAISREQTRFAVMAQPWEPERGPKMAIMAEAT